ncbi:MAG: cob(I)yrinic acid a,c-diamide adenosyltransferase [Nitrospinae bacterium]|nr:cob(I)yrinic acid a,c-diamide adenosyltransferase [Nitrospinota bacterium]
MSPLPSQARHDTATHLILAGRGATPELIALADMVSNIDSIKHPYEAGISAQKGLDF